MSLFTWRYACRYVKKFLIETSLVVAASVLLAWNSAMGAEPEREVPSETQFYAEIPVVLTVTRLAQPKSEAPAAVTVIDREMIRASGARRIADLFRLVPGFQVAYDSGTFPVVTYHGLSGNYAQRLQVLVDGRSVYDIFIGGVFWNDLPLAIEDIDRIEVIRGPNTAAFGSNSFLGVINIVTLHAAQGQGTELKLAAGEHRVRDGLARHGWQTTDGHARLTVGYRHDDGFDGVLDSERASFATFRGDYRLGRVDTLEWQMGVNGNTYDTGHVDNPLDVPRDYNTTSHFQQLRWRRALGSNEEISVQFFHNYWRLDQDYQTAPLDLSAFGLGMVQVPITLDAVGDRYDLEFQHILGPFSDWRFVWGAGARLDRAQSRPYFSTDKTLEDRIYRLFGNAEWRARPDTVVNAGAMLEKNGLGGTDLSPRLAINHHLTPRDTVRVAASKATRAPTLLEEKGNQQILYNGVLLDQGNLSEGGLRPENMRSYEIGYLGQLPARNLSLDVRVYRDQLRDLIRSGRIPFPDIDGKAFVYRNSEEVDISGAEIQLDYRPSRDTRLFLSYARMRASASSLISADRAREYEDSVPAYSGSLLVMHRFADRWQGSAVYHRVGAMDWLGSGDYVKSHGRLDVRLARDVRLDGTRGEIALVIQNLGPKTVEFDQKNVFDRRAFVTFALRR